MALLVVVSPILAVSGGLTFTLASCTPAVQKSRGLLVKLDIVALHKEGYERDESLRCLSPARLYGFRSV